MSLYLYCLIDDAIAEDVLLSSAPEGISGSLVTFYSSADFGLLVSDFAGTSVPVTRENVLKHAAVVSAVLPVTTPLPFRFGTLVTEAELESYLSARAAALRAKQDLVRGCVEMSVKIIWDREWTPEQSAAGKSDKPGTSFLVEKRSEILGGEARAAEAKRIAGWLAECLGNAVKDLNLKTNTTEKLLVSAAHLVERGSVERYKAALRSAELERPELHFLASGPWPPYSFANINLEFQTQFGVS